MNDPAIRVENLGKLYRIGSARERNKTLRETLVDAAKAPFLRAQEAWSKGSHSQPQAPSSPHAEGISPLSAPSSPHAEGISPLSAPSSMLSPCDGFIWALRNVSFEVKRGEVVGIIGRNGAGKSTLLKILARITEPTEGRVVMRGRVGSLLEVGTGFHSELTGEENIYLSGTILGLSSREISNKFNEIVSFAEMGKFIHTPVKHYSSGMYMRLAFAVAAHLEPEILLIDEVLAVGDAQFQKKCLGKMGDIANAGRTVMFVSHNMSATQSLCEKTILLQDGRVDLYDKTNKVIQFYLNESYDLSKNVFLKDRSDRIGSGKVIVVDFKAMDCEKREIGILQSGKDYSFQIEYLNITKSCINNVVVSLDFFDEKNNRVLMFRTNFTNNNISLFPDNGYIYCLIKNMPLANGIYGVSIFISHADAEILDYITDAAFITVDGGDFFGTGSFGLPGHCKILHKANWSSHSTLTDN